MSCGYNCENSCEECDYPDLVMAYIKGKSEGLEDFTKWVNENQMKEFNIDIMIANKGNANIEDLIKLYLSQQS